MKPRFISDIHLSDKHPELTQAFFTFLNESKEACTHLYILGDLFEAWIGDDDTTPLAQEVKSALRAFTDNGPATFFIHGNRDFLIGETFAKETGITILPDPYTLTINDQKVVISHGDFLCTDDVDYITFRNHVYLQLSLLPFSSKLRGFYDQFTAYVVESVPRTQQGNRAKHRCAKDADADPHLRPVRRTALHVCAHAVARSTRNRREVQQTEEARVVDWWATAVAVIQRWEQRWRR